MRPSFASSFRMSAHSQCEAALRSLALYTTEPSNKNMMITSTRPASRLTRTPDIV